MSEPGEYGIDLKATACRADWNTVKNKKDSSLIRRHQYPVQPDFSATIYSVQGLTMKAVIASLNFNAWTNAVSGYVAMSRVQSAEDLLIMMPFRLVS